jgi:DNA polymerase-3 subunit epsilon
MAGIVGLFFLPGLLGAAMLIALYRWGAFPDTFTLLITVVVGLAAMMAYLGLIAHTVGRSLVRTVQQIQEGTELVATVNPDHRLEVSTGDELERLANEINGLADRLRHSLTDAAEAVTQATAAVAVERTTLADILDGLGNGVVVLSLEGRVPLANRAAVAQFGATLLGQSFFDFVEREPIVDLVAQLRMDPRAAVSTSLRDRSGLGLDAVVTALMNGERQLSGLVAVFRGQLSLTTPTGAPASPLVGAGFLSGSTSASLGDRPVFYDWALLDDMERHTSPAQRSQALADLSYTVVDVETTGLEPERGDRIVSVACARVRRGVVRPGEILDALVNPDRPIPPASTRIHGITDDMVANAPTIDQIVPALIRFAEGTVIVGHHVWFDLRFLREVTDRLRLAPLMRSHPVLDTRSLSQIVHGSVDDHDLEAVATRLGLVVRGRHSALGDALTTAEVFSRLLGLLERRGIRSLGQALTATRAIGPRPLLSWAPASQWGSLSGPRAE